MSSSPTRGYNRFLNRNLPQRRAATGGPTQNDARQAEAIRRWKPWGQATGPRTAEGKARSTRNAYRGGHWRELRELSKAMNALLRAQRDGLGRFID